MDDGLSFVRVCYDIKCFVGNVGCKIIRRNKINVVVVCLFVCLFVSFVLFSIVIAINSVLSYSLLLYNRTAALAVLVVLILIVVFLSLLCFFSLLFCLACFVPGVSYFVSCRPSYNIHENRTYLVSGTFNININMEIHRY